MLRSVCIVLVLTAAAPAFAQGSGGPTQNSKGPPVLGPTGTMYDGNNARLSLPSERNAWFLEQWAGYVPVPAGPPAAATGAGAAGTSLGTTETGGEH